MATDLLDGGATDKGFLHVRDYKGKPFYEARWRDLEHAAQAAARACLGRT